MRFYSHSHHRANRKRKSAFGGFVKSLHEVRALSKKIREHETKESDQADKELESTPDHLWND